MPQIYPLDLLTNVVVNLRQTSTAGQVITGTGFLISHNSKLYLVTAEHVAKEMKIDCEFVVKGTNDLPVLLSLEDLTQQKNSLDWKFHTIADIAVLELSPKREVLVTKLLNRFLPSENISQNTSVVDRNTQLTIIGFPLGLGATGHFSPLTFRTYASSGLITLNRFDNSIPCTFFILENPGVSGYSGGPIIDVAIYINMGMEITGNATMVYGIMHGTIPDATGGKLAAVTPSYYLFDII
ncbi:MAG TPA: trypsin-like peptidase domain-containing protein [Ignavibacteria bacterium]|nr:trypsin-like peptidase domain-containing protein [Ignavibacteria bacterium]